LGTAKEPLAGLSTGAAIPVLFPLFRRPPKPLGSAMNTDQAWEEWGRQNPYFGVLADKKFRSENLTASTKAEFFATGDDHVRHVMDVCRHHFDPDFQPQRILDFGCGTGRLVIPFAKTAAEVVGLDVSDSMLAEARRNCESHGLVNVQLLKSADTIGDSLGEFDLVHSFIVFQHIPVAKGMHILRQVLRRVRQGGFAAIHITYSRKAYRRFVNANPYLPRPFYEWIRGSDARSNAFCGEPYAASRPTPKCR